MKLEKNCALLVIDIQQEDFMEMNESNMEEPRWNVIRNVKRVLDVFRAMKLPVIQIKECHRPDMVDFGRELDGSEGDETFMREAIRLSRLAAEHGNEPFGAVLVKDGKIVFSNENQIYTKHDPTFHGEAGLIREFCAQTAITDLHEYTLYSSCEPCFMCSGAMVWVKLGRLVYGVSNMELEAILGNKGCNCSAMVFENSFWQPQVTEGVLREESLEILNRYFGTHQKG